MLWISKSKIWTSDWNVSLLLACDWTGSSWQLHVVINCDKLVKIRNVLRSATNLFLSTYRQIHDNYLHPESRQNLTNLKEKFRNSSPKRVTAVSLSQMRSFGDSLPPTNQPVQVLCDLKRSSSYMLNLWAVSWLLKIFVVVLWQQQTNVITRQP